MIVRLSVFVSSERCQPCLSLAFSLASWPTVLMTMFLPLPIDSSMWYSRRERCTLAVLLPPQLCPFVRCAQLASPPSCCVVHGHTAPYVRAHLHNQHPSPSWATPLQSSILIPFSSRRHNHFKLQNLVATDQRIFSKFVLMVRSVVIQFFDRLLHMVWNGRRRALHLFKPPP